MRIAMFSWESLYAIKIGGVGIHVFNLAKNLAGLGHEVHIFTRQGANQSFDDTIEGVYLHRLPWDNEKNFLQEVKAFNNTLVYYYTEIVSSIGRFDIIHCHDWLTFNAGSRLQNEATIISTFHTTEWGRSGNWPESPKAKEISSVEKEAIQKSSHLIAVSYEVRRQVELLYNAPDWKLDVIHHGVTLPAKNDTIIPIREELSIPETSQIILYVGSLNYKKGTDVLLNTCQEVLNSTQDTTYIIIGNGEMQGRVEGITRDFPNRVILLTAIEPAKIKTIYKECNIVVVPFRYDPFAVVTLTAWSMKKPVITTGKGATSEIIYDNVNGIKSNEQNLSKDIIKLLQDREQAAWLGANAGVTVKTAFTWEKIAQKTTEIYDKALTR